MSKKSPRHTKVNRWYCVEGCEFCPEIERAAKKAHFPIDVTMLSREQALLQKRPLPMLFCKNGMMADAILGTHDGIQSSNHFQSLVTMFQRIKKDIRAYNQRKKQQKLTEESR